MGRMQWIVLGAVLALLGAGVALTSPGMLWLGALWLGMGMGIAACMGWPPKSASPWALQRYVMRISDQQLPESPSLTSTSMLYFALIMEEAGEMGLHLHEAIHRFRMFSPEGEKLNVGVSRLYSCLADQVESDSRLMRQSAKTLRELVAAYESLTGEKTWEFRLTPAEAINLLDDTTDVAVVNSGFCEATGLPGAAAFDEVTQSNISKANPDTGVIDKDPSGKWIKGPDYRPPNLERILFDHLGT